MTWTVMRIYHDDAVVVGVNRCETEVEARALANILVKEGGQVWIEEQQGRNRTYVDTPAERISPENVTALRQSLRAPKAG